MTIRGPAHLTKSLARAAELGLELSQLHALLPDLLLGEAGGALELRGAQPSAFDGGFALNQRPISERELLLSRRELAISAGDRDLAPLELSEPLLEGSLSGDHRGLLLRRRLLLHAQRRLRHPEGVERASSSAVITSVHHQRSSPAVITRNHHQKSSPKIRIRDVIRDVIRAVCTCACCARPSSEIIIKKGHQRSSSYLRLLRTSLAVHQCHLPLPKRSIQLLCRLLPLSDCPFTLLQV